MGFGGNDFGGGDFGGGGFGGGFGGGAPSKREMLEIDSDGLSTAEKKAKKEQERMEAMQQKNPGGYNSRGMGGGRFSRFSRHGRNSSHGGGSWLSVLAAFGIIAFFGVLVWVMMTSGLKGVWRNALSTKEANQTMLFQGVLESQEQLKDTYVDTTTEEQANSFEFYKKNRILSSEYLDKQSEPEYLVFVYTFDSAKNKPFMDLVTELENSDFPVPIYRAKLSVAKDMFFMDSLGDDNPGLIVYRNNTGKVAYDSIIGADAIQQEGFQQTLTDYMNQLIKEDDEFFISQREGFQEATWRKNYHERKELEAKNKENNTETEKE